MAGKDTGEVRKRFFGNPEIAQRFMGPARLLLGQLKEDMAFNSLQQGVRRAVIPLNQRIEIGPELSKEGDADITRRFVQLLGSVAIVATSSHGQSEVWIDARAVNTTEVVVEPKVPEGLYVPSLFIALEGPYSLTQMSEDAHFETISQHNHVLGIREPWSAPIPFNQIFNGLQDFPLGIGVDSWHQDITLAGYFPYTVVTLGFLPEEQQRYAQFENGLCSIGDTIHPYPHPLFPEPIAKAFDKVMAIFEEAVLYFIGGWFLDPANEGLAIPQKVVPGWYLVDVLNTFQNEEFYNTEIVQEDNEGRALYWPPKDFRIVVELGKNPPQRFEFEYAVPPGGNWDKSLLINVEHGVIAEIPRLARDADGYYPVLDSPPEPGPGTKFYYHDLSPLLAEQSQ